MSIFDRDKSAERTPVSLITGFLGSGKTTLLNHLLRHPDMRDSAVIINEFGEIGLDHLLIEAVDGEVALMANGCICCTVRSDLEATLRRLLAHRDAGTVPWFSRVLVETTGLADPAPIMQLLLNNPLVSHFVRLDAVMTTVDAVHGAMQLQRHATAVKQVALADRLLLTKSDLADGAALLPALRALNRAAPVIEVRHGEVAPELLFGAAPARDVRGWIAEEVYTEDAMQAHGIASCCLSFDAPLPWQSVTDWLTVLRQRHGQDLLRVKGILNLQEEPGPVIVHGVHHVFHPPVRLRQWPDQDRRSRMVFITQGLSPSYIESLLEH